MDLRRIVEYTLEKYGTIDIGFLAKKIVDFIFIEWDKMFMTNIVSELAESDILKNILDIGLELKKIHWDNIDMERSRLFQEEIGIELSG